MLPKTVHWWRPFGGYCCDRHPSASAQQQFSECWDKNCTTAVRQERAGTARLELCRNLLENRLGVGPAYKNLLNCQTGITISPAYRGSIKGKNLLPSVLWPEAVV